MLPDPDNPVFYVYAETDGLAGGEAAAGEDGSESLVSEYAELVEELIKGV